MEKKQEISPNLCSNWHKLLLIMKITTLLLIIGTFSVSANTYSQSFTIHVNNVSLKEVVDLIKQQSEYSFVYEDSLIELYSKVSVSVTDENVSKILDKILNGKNIGYRIKDKHIILYDKTKATDVPQDKNEERITIRGQVFDKAEPPMPLPGVTIQIKGKNTGVASDVDGYFKIEANKNDVLIFSSVGFKPVEFTVKRSQSNLVIALQENVNALNEVVVTGFTEERKLNSISALSQVKLDATLDNKPITSLSQALQGGVTGIAVTQSSGLPGGDAATIKIRGISTLGNSDPLVLVDGIPMDMNNLDPTTIESVTVLKDAAAAAIYGSRAANGVIVVKTKRGSVGKVRVSYSGYAGVQKATYMPDFVDSPTYMSMVNEAYKNTGGDPVYSEETIQNTLSGIDPYKYPDTDWISLMWKDQVLQNHSVSVQGGNSIARFAVTANYMQQDGFLKNYNYDRLNLRANTTVNLRENISVDVDLNMIRSNQHQPSVAESGGDNPFNLVYWIPPTIVGKYPGKANDRNDYYGNFGTNMRNPMAQLEKGGYTQQLTDNISVNLQPRWTIIPGLNLKGQLSYRVNSGVKKQERHASNFFDYDNGQLICTWNNYFSAETSRSSYYYVGGTVDYTVNLDKHRIFLIAGTNAEMNNSNAWDEYSMHSMFGKVNYTFDSRYLLEVTLRSDGSSRFGKGHKYGLFPSVAGGWNVHEEAFMKQFDWLNNFKLRASYGQLGNENIGLYKYQSLIDPGNGSETVFGNPDISWEKVNMLDLGADLSFLDGMIDLTFDYYDKLTTDILLTPPLSFVGGMGASTINAGKVRNKGWELSANFAKKIGDWDISLFGGLSQNKNEIELLIGGPYDNGSSIHKEGYPLSSHYMYRSDGLLQESDFVSDGKGNLIPKDGVVIIDGQKPGDIHYKDINGDKMITPDDREIMGTGQPKLNYFANISAKWKGIDFEMMMQGVSGVEAFYSGNYATPLNLDGYSTTPQWFHQDYWTPQNTDARFPRMTPTPGENAKSSDYWKFDASYCRVKYIQLGYTINPTLTNKFFVSNLRFFVNLQNPFTIAQENKIDPEARGGQSTYPLVKTYSAGLNISF